MNIYDPATDSWSSGASMPVATTTPGYAQAGQYVYVVGGWGDGSPDRQRRRHPALRPDHRHMGDRSGVRQQARSDLALSASKTAIYAAGGDADGGGAFDSTARRRTARRGAAGPACAGRPSTRCRPRRRRNNAGACTEDDLRWGDLVGRRHHTQLRQPGRTFFRSTSEARRAPASGRMCPGCRSSPPKARSPRTAARWSP